MDHELERTLLALCNLSESTTLPDALERLDMFRVHAQRVVSRWRVAEAGFEEACKALEKAKKMVEAMRPVRKPRRRRA